MKYQRMSKEQAGEKNEAEAYPSGIGRESVVIRIRSIRGRKRRCVFKSATAKMAKVRRILIIRTEFASLTRNVWI